MMTLNDTSTGAMKREGKEEVRKREKQKHRILLVFIKILFTRDRNIVTFPQAWNANALCR